MQVAAMKHAMDKINKKFGAGTIGNFGQRTTFPETCARHASAACSRTPALAHAVRACACAGIASAQAC